MKRLAIVGAGGHGRVVAETAEWCGWDDIVFYDDRHNELCQNGPWPVIGSFFELLDCSSFDGVIVAVGKNSVRKKLLDELLNKNFPVVSFVHPSATISNYSDIGNGTIILPGAVVNMGTLVGRGCIVNTHASIDHDCQIKDGVHISPGAHLAGGVQIGNCSWIGLGACIREYLEVGSHVTIGAGAVVVKNIADNLVVAGVPAKELSSI